MNNPVQPKAVHILIDNVHMRRPGISDLVRNNGVRYKAKWVLAGTGVIVSNDIVYTSATKDTREEVVALALAWLAKHPEYTEGE